MKQTRLLKTLLAAVCLLVGTSAWGDGTKRILNSVNYESATASDWSGPNINNTLVSGDATYGKYVKVTPDGSGNRSAYKSVAFAYTAGSGKTASDMATTGYVIEFDMLMSGGNVKERSESQFIIPTTGPNLATNTTYSGTDYIFALSQKQRDDASRITGWYINDLTNATDKTVALSFSTWYHYKIVVTGTSVTYTITHNNQTDATGSKTVETLPTITGFFGCLGRGSGEIRFDNLEIYDYTEEVTVSAPTFTLNKVDGVKRNYTINNPDGNGTLYYTTSPAEEAPAVGAAAYTSTTKNSATVDFSESGNYYAYVLHSNGTTSSAITTQVVTAGEITLNKPWIWISSMVANGSYYNMTLDSDHNQSSVLLSPTATLSATFTPDGGTASAVTLPYTATSKGTLTVTSSAEGYTSASVTFDVEALYEQTWQSLDFSSLVGTAAVQAALGEEWTQQSGHGRWASWNKDKDGSYNFYQHGSASSSTITINNKIRMREVVLLAEGMGLGRNNANGEAISIVSSTGEIVAFEIYNGYGNDINKGTNTYMQYSKNTSGNPSMTSSNGALLVQAAIYSPASYTLADGEAVRLTFDNAGTTGANDNNFKIDFYNSSSEKVANIRADWWDETETNGNAFYTYGYTYSSDGGATADNTNVWSSFQADMTDADIDLTLSYKDGTLYVIGTMTHDNKVYYVNYSKDGMTGDLTYNLYGNNASLSNISVASTSVVTTPAHPTNVAVTLGSNGYTTYANNVYPLDLTNATAYKASVSGDKVNFTLFEQAVPASTGMLVGGNGTVNLPIADASTAVEGNEFLVNTSGAVFNAEENTTYYAMLKDSNPLAFGTFNPSTLAFPATKAYLKVANNAGAKALTAFFGGDVTGISKVENGVKTNDNNVYNLAGQRVIKPTKGLYIVNGKKVIVKNYE